MDQSSAGVPSANHVTHLRDFLLESFLGFPSFGTRRNQRTRPLLKLDGGREGGVKGGKWRGEEEIRWKNETNSGRSKVVNNFLEHFGTF